VVAHPAVGLVIPLAAQAAVPRDIGLWEWFSRGETWTGDGGILGSLVDTLTLCAIVMAVSVVIAVPLAAVLSHYRRGELSATWVLNTGRAIPTFAIAGLLVPICLRNGWGFEPWPMLIALTMLALPPIYLTTYTGVRQADPGAVDAARAMGYRERDVLFKVELALAVSLIFSGLRVAAVQVVATEPIRAYLGGDGLGRYVRDGLGQNNDTLLIGGAILVAGLATITGLLLGLIERLFLPRGARRLRQVQTQRAEGRT
jgi:osmoprotectant transport system permease protein